MITLPPSARTPSVASAANAASASGVVQDGAAGGTAAPATSPLLALQGLSKRYPNGVLANDAITLQLQRGEVHAVLGENGAGKSTLLKLLYGLERPDAGQIVLEGEAVQWRSPADALAAGIGLVPQHLQLLASMTVAENLVLGVEPLRWGRLDAAAAIAAAEQTMQRHGLALPARARVGALSAGQQQRVAILKALHRGARLLLLDEPTALLAPVEAEALFDSLRGLVQQGLAVLLISHKMAEVRAVADRYTVLRAGRVAGSGSAQGVSATALATLMMGRDVAPLPTTRVNARGAQPPRLALRELTVLQPGGRPLLDRVTLDVARGEILGIAGVEGHGQSALADVLGGLRRASHGTLSLDGQPLRCGAPQALRARGIGRIGEDRLHDGIAPSLSIAENLAALDYRAPGVTRWGRLNRTLLGQRARQLIERYGIVAAGAEASLDSLSGGNMQKVVMARELAAQPRCLVAHQPTRGVDVGAAQRLHSALLALRDHGAAVLLISADIDELLALSDRLVVLFEGRLVAHFAADAVSPRTLGLGMIGALGAGPVEARLESPFQPATHGGIHGDARSDTCASTGMGTGGGDSSSGAPR